LYQTQFAQLFSLTIVAGSEEIEGSKRPIEYLARLRFQDEMRIGQKNKLTYRRVTKARGLAPLTINAPRQCSVYRMVHYLADKY
jgi:hypothetical protein